jgi:hypothetical protein
VILCRVPIIVDLLVVVRSLWVTQITAATLHVVPVVLVKATVTVTANVKVG